LSIWEETTTWLAVGASAIAALALVGVFMLVGRLARSRRELRNAQDAAGAGEDGAQAHAELGWFRHLSEIGATIDLEGVLERTLGAAARLGNASAAMIVLAVENEEPLIATFGLSEEESSRELLGLPPEGGQARAVTIAYRYTEDEEDYDEFRLRGGLAVPVAGDEGRRVGTLAVFWRRVEHEITDEELARLEALTGALSPALDNALRFEELRRLVDLDPATGLHTPRSLHESLVRECSRARRYERRLSLVLMRLDAPLTTELLATAGERLGAAVRKADIPCHLDDGRFAVVLPEAALADAERLCRRLQSAVGATLGTNGRVRLPAGIVELRPEDDGVSLLERAEAALAREEEAGGELPPALQRLG
jgi:GGDEF domain-containing protein